MKMSAEHAVEYPALATLFGGEYPPDHADGCKAPWCCLFHALSGQSWYHSDNCERGGPRYDMSGERGQR